MTPIAHIETDYRTKFGVPRQAGLVGSRSRIVFEPEYRVPEAVRGLEEFDYIWIIWEFHLAERDEWSPTVRPPRLGGNKRVGVFASRSPFRPNPIGLSSVRLLKVEHNTKMGPVLEVDGADLVDGTPIFDIKPYITYVDSHSDARSGFAQIAPKAMLKVDDPDKLLTKLPDDKAKTLTEALAHDPRPHYQTDGERVYVMLFADWEVRFRVEKDRLTIVRVD